MGELDKKLNSQRNREMGKNWNNVLQCIVDGHCIVNLAHFIGKHNRHIYCRNPVSCFYSCWWWGMAREQLLVTCHFCSSWHFRPLSALCRTPHPTLPIAPLFLPLYLFIRTKLFCTLRTFVLYYWTGFPPILISNFADSLLPPINF